MHKVRDRISVNKITLFIGIIIIYHILSKSIFQLWHKQDEPSFHSTKTKVRILISIFAIILGFTEELLLF
jgi:uncharacterized membrane protein